MSFPSPPPSLDHSNYTWRRVQVMKLLIPIQNWSQYYSSVLITVYISDRRMDFLELPEGKKN
jgi:hypothetical protein